MSVSGSSPRVRGTRSLVAIWVEGGGIIPACAGNTRRRTCRRTRRRDHPRVCGEHLTRTFQLMLTVGSSPRVRGTPSKAVSSLSTTGSSPRVRGTLLSIGVDAIEHGIIPACAGNTTRQCATATLRRDHPRVCGEHPMSAPISTPVAGSSPRVRGTLEVVDLAGEHPGIIPACAGNTTSGMISRKRTRDHPRVCGEHHRIVRRRRAVLGSSPRVRGTLDVEGLQQDACGIIPACAGNTQTAARCWTTRRDHPRVCGEHYKAKYEELKGEGSSPRVRGTRDCRFQICHDDGIIPACAGNTDTV